MSVRPAAMRSRSGLAWLALLLAATLADIGMRSRRHHDWLDRGAAHLAAGDGGRHRPDPAGETTTSPSWPPAPSSPSAADQAIARVPSRTRRRATTSCSRSPPRAPATRSAPASTPARTRPARPARSTRPSPRRRSTRRSASRAGPPPCAPRRASPSRRRRRASPPTATPARWATTSTTTSCRSSSAARPTILATCGPSRAPRPTQRTRSRTSCARKCATAR